MGLIGSRRLSGKVTLLLSIFIAVLGVAIVTVVRGILIGNTEKALMVVAEQGAAVIEARLNGQLEALEAVATLNAITDTDVPAVQKVNSLRLEAQKKGFLRISLADAAGQSVTTDGGTLYVGDREYFKRAYRGEKYVSASLRSRVDGALVVIFAVPVEVDGRVQAVLYATQDVAALSQYTDQIRYTQQGNSFLLDGAGYLIAHDDPALVSRRNNDFENVKTDARLQKLVDIERHMVAGGSGVGTYSYQGVVKHIGYAPIGNTGWSLGVAVPGAGILSGMYNILVIVSVVFILLLLATVFWSATYQRLETKYAVQKAMAANAVECAGIYIVRLSAPTWRILSCNSIFKGMFPGADEPERGLFSQYTGLSPMELGRLLTAGQPFEAPIYAGGRPFYARWSIVDYSPDEYHYDLMGVDVTDNREFRAAMERKNEELNALMERYLLAADASRDIIWDYDIATGTAFFSDRFFEMVGMTREYFEGGHLRPEDLLHEDDMNRIRQIYNDHARAKTDSFGGEFRLATANGQYKWVLCRGRSVTNAGGEIARIVGSLTDITERKHHEEEVYHLAYYDQLTGLPNRVYVQNELGKRFAGRGMGASGAVLLIDIDNFKLANDTFGHGFGDEMLRGIAARLETLSDGRTCVARLGGDEFFICRQADDAAAFAQRVRQLFDDMLVVWGNKMHVSCSIGISLYPTDGETIHDLLQKADMAMYKAKTAGRNMYMLYHNAIGKQLSELAEMDKQIRQALANREFELYYQPLVDVSTGNINGFEALLRWHSPVYGNVPPDKFIPLAEEVGLIVDIGRWVIEQTAAFTSKVQSAGISVSCNVSAMQLAQSGFSDELVEVWDRWGLAPGSMALEITESCLVQSFDEVCRTLQALQRKGFLIYLDDFGTGYSSLTYLKKLPIDVVKIDKSFVDDISKNDVERRIVSTIVTLAHEIGLDVFAEGVETREQYDCLAASRCNAIQGYYFSRPVPESRALELLEAGALAQSI